MKLKEKLAKEYSNRIRRNSDTLFFCENKAYLAGFEKAREFAASIEWNASGNSEEFHEIQNLGEEEV